MPLKKQERKEAYGKIVTAMGKGQNKKAWDALLSMMSGDVGVFILGSYEDILEANKPKDD